MAFASVSHISGSGGNLRPSRISLQCPWLAVAIDNDLRLLQVGDGFQSPIESPTSSSSISLPSPHVRSIAALSFERVVGSDSFYLLSVSEDALVVWKNPQSFDEFLVEDEANVAESSAAKNRASISYRCQKLSAGPFVDVTHVTLNGLGGDFVALSAGNDVVLVCLINGAEARLPHRRPVVQTSFPSSPFSSSLSSSSHPVHLISISVDASLRCWDVKTMSCLRLCDSVFRLSSPLSCLQSSYSSVLGSMDCFVGDCDGNLFRLSFNAGSSSGELSSQRIDLKSHLDKWRRRRRRQMKTNDGGTAEEPDGSVVPGSDVLTILAIDDRLIFIALSSALLLFDASINECLSAIYYGDPIPKSCEISRQCGAGTRGSESEDAITFPIASTVSASLSATSGFVYSASIATFSGLTTIVRAKLPANSHTTNQIFKNFAQNDTQDSVQHNNANSSPMPSKREDNEEDDYIFPDISVVATEALTENSALKTPPLTPNIDDGASNKPAKPKPVTRKGSAGSVKKTPALDQPVTVRDKVKSSGYSVPPRNLKMFQPNTNFSSSKKSPSTKIGTSSKQDRPSEDALSSKSRATDSFPSSAPLPTAVVRDICLSESRATPVSALSVSSCGSNVACGVTDYNITIVGESLAEKSVTSHAGHRGVVHVANWSHDGAWLVTASSDKTALVWRKAAADPAMVFEDRRNNFAVDKVTPQKDQKPFPAELRHAQFYYLDKFLLLASANKFFLYVHYLDAAKNDLQRYKTGSRYKLVKEYDVEDVQAIVAASAVNSFYSHLVLSACSNKSVDVLDLNVGRSLLRIEDAHEAKIHTVSQNQGSRHSALSFSEAYNLFLTAAVGACEGVKLWDLRTPRFPVRLFNKHVNRVLPTCTASFSPCGRFVASGSEDCHAYLYDVGSGSVEQKYRAKDGASVTHVAFHPLHMRLFMASLSGNLYLIA